jgi:uncharacterized iron-regulated membrane protein
MLRRNHLIVIAALVAVCAVPGTASAWQTTGTPDQQAGEVAPPPSSIAVSAADEYQDLRSPDAKDAAVQAEATQQGQDLRSPDATDAAAHRGIYENEKPYVLTRDYGSPDTADLARGVQPVDIQAPVVEVHEPSTGFDWGDAGIGAAGMLALFSIAAGSALLLVSRRRREDLGMAAH